MAGTLAAPSPVRAIGFFDGQNLYRHAKDAFNHSHPNFDPQKLHNAVCSAKGWQPAGVRFYTGTPAQERQPMWHGYWANRLLTMRRAGIAVFSRSIRYRTNDFALPDGTVYEVDSAQEKGIDVRIAIDVLRLAVSGQYDAAVIFSQDQDLVEVADEVKHLSRNQSRWLQVVSAFPDGPNATSRRGIDKTDWFRMDRDFYEKCLDEHDYRPAQSIVMPNPIPSIRLKERGPY